MEKAKQILIVEDNPADARLIKEALKESEIQSKLNIVEDGVEAIEYLYKKGKYKDVVLPDIIILDLNLPKMDGREVLAKIKKHASLRNIPVIVMTISQNEDDVVKTYNLHANCYVVKPLDFNNFMKTVKGIEDFWFGTVMLPKAM